MSRTSPSENLVATEELLQHADWMRRLARKLVRDEAAADDLVQDAWLAAMKRPPLEASNLRGWLARVLSNRARDHARSGERRRQRERETARSEDLPSELDVLEEAARARDVAGEVLSLDEPYRTVLLLRYWRDWKPARIADELERSVHTVNTQLQRGLERLRQRLDERYGDRGAWIAWMLPLCSPPAKAFAVSTLSAGALGVWMLGAAILVAAWFGAAALLGAKPQDRIAEAVALAPAQDPARAPLRAVDPLPVENGDEVERRSLGSDEVGEPAAVFSGRGSEPSAVRSLTGRVVDLDGRPVVGATVVWNDPDRLDWADASRSAISSSRIWVPVPEAVREDPEAWEEFARERLTDADQGLVLLAGGEVPRHEARTDELGRYGFDVPGRTVAVEFEHPELGYLGRGVLSDELGGDNVRVLAPTYRLEGRLLGPEGRPVAGARFELSNAELLPRPGVFEALSTSDLRPTEASTDEQGRFVFQGVPLADGAVVRCVSCPGDLPAELAWKRLGMDAFGTDRAHRDLEFRLFDLPMHWQVSGRVLSADGSPAARATVHLAELAALTDRDGRYALRLPRQVLDERDDGRGWLGAQTLRASRWSAGITELALESYVPPKGWLEVTLPDVVLAPRAAAIEGRVLGHDGSARAGARVLLFGTHQALDADRSLEQVSSGASFDGAITGEDGRFRIEGLANRPYTLLAEDGAERSDSLEVEAGETAARLALRP